MSIFRLCSSLHTYTSFALLLLGTAACSFDSGGVDDRPDAAVVTIDAATPNPIDAAPVTIDADPAAEELGDVAHVPPAAEFTGRANGDLFLAVDATINTDLLTINSFAYPDREGLIVFDEYAQDPGGFGAPRVAVLHVDEFRIGQDATVTIFGARPLVIIANNEVRIDGILDASANGQTPGPGGFLPGEGLGGVGAGQDGNRLDLNGIMHSGGGGGGYGCSGREGGNGCNVDNICVPGGEGGDAFGQAQIATLAGGAGGGDGGFSVGGCSGGSGGAGGGAVQIHSKVRIDIGATGGIHVGGGGGRPGLAIGCQPTDSGGGGGGAAGAVFLQAPRVEHRGVIAALGGGGGGGAGDRGDAGRNEQDGSAGADADLSPDAAAGGNGAISGGGRGGDGGNAVDCAGNEGEANTNGGGGGGAAGRVAIVSRFGFENRGTIIPPPNTSTY